MASVFINKTARIIDGSLKGFEGLVVAYDSLNDEVKIKLLDGTARAIVSSSSIEQ